MEETKVGRTDSIRHNNYGFYHKMQELNHPKPFASPDRHDCLGFAASQRVGWISIMPSL